jgi:hypothetical protein
MAASAFHSLLKLPMHMLEFLLALLAFKFHQTHILISLLVFEMALPGLGVVIREPISVQ